MPEGWIGTEEAFQIDHFKPQHLFFGSIEAHRYTNLFWCCPACNKAKAGEYPSVEDELYGIGYVDFCLDNFSDHFKLGDDMALIPLTVKARYTLEVLRLNRSSLVTLRSELANLGKGTLPDISPLG